MLDKINNWIKAGLLSAVVALANAVISVISFLEKREQKKEQKEKEKTVIENNKKIDDVCDNGSLDDLKNLVKRLCIVSCIMLSGCTTIQINKTYDWEGHYKTVEQFRNATYDMKLDKTTSVWVLSNVTLKNLLKDIESKRQ